MFKFQVGQRDLSDNLQLAGQAVPSRPSHPILSSLRLEFGKDSQPTATLSGFDLAMSVETSFPVEVDTTDGVPLGAFTVPAKLIRDIISRLPDGSLTLEGDETGHSNVITVASSSGNYEIRTTECSDFPELPSIQDGTQLTLPGATFLKGLKYALYTASDDESKQILTGVRITIDANGMEFASTDGHRLSVFTVPVEETTDDAGTVSPTDSTEVTIPAKSLTTLASLLSKQGADTQVIATFDGGQAIFELDGCRVTSRLLEGQYPNYRQLVPTQFQRRVVADRKAMLRAVELIAIVADLKNNIIKLSLNAAEQAVTLSADAQDVGSGKERLLVQYTGEDLDVSFNAKYLAQALKIIETDEVTIDLNTATSPAIIRPITGDKYTCLLMPVQVRTA